VDMRLNRSNNTNRGFHDQFIALSRFASGATPIVLSSVGGGIVEHSAYCDIAERQRANMRCGCRIDSLNFMQYLTVAGIVYSGITLCVCQGRASKYGTKARWFGLETLSSRQFEYQFATKVSSNQRAFASLNRHLRSCNDTAEIAGSITLPAPSLIGAK
jgi:hypothetical protein